MIMSLNRVIFVGRLASDPVLLGFTAREKTIIGLTVDVTSRDRFEITLYSRLADRIQGWHASGWFREGRHVLVEASLPVALASSQSVSCGFPLRIRASSPTQPCRRLTDSL